METKYKYAETNFQHHPFISVGLGIANAVWGDELIYNHFDN